MNNWSFWFMNHSIIFYYDFIFVWYSAVLYYTWMLFSLCSLPREMHCVPSSVPQLQILRVTCGRVSFSQKKKKRQHRAMWNKNNKIKKKQKKKIHRDKRETLVVTCRKASNISCKKKKSGLFSNLHVKACRI